MFTRRRSLRSVDYVRRAALLRRAVTATGLVALLGAVAMLAGCDYVTTAGGASTAATSTPVASTSPTATIPLSPTAGGYSVQVYFSKHPASDNDISAVFPVHRVSPTSGVATYTMQQLIAGPISSETAAGYYTELHGALSGASTCGGADFQISLNTHVDPHTGAKSTQQGTAVVAFCKVVSLPGDLSGGRIKAQIDTTLTQFATIHTVQILTKDGHCFDDLSGQNNC